MSRDGNWVIRWIERFCVYSDGPKIGEPARLLPWQKTWIREVYGVDPSTGLRRYRWSLLGVAKKNGKSQLLSWLALYHLIGDEEPSPLVVVAASSEDQADIIFGLARRCVELSPLLTQVVDVYERELTVPSVPGARLRRLAAVAGANDGMNISACVLDELHEWSGDRGRAVWTVLTNGVGARTQPMILQATTAGYDVDGTICGELYQYGKRVETGEITDPRFHFRWWEPPVDANYRDPEVWKQANPSWGVTLPDPEPYLRDQFTRKPEATFRRYFLNQWTTADELWLPDGAWDDCVDPDLELDPELPLFVGIDLAVKRDSTAVVCLQPNGDRWVVRSRIWENPYPIGDERREGWRMNLSEITNHLEDLYRMFPMPGTDVDGEPHPGPAFGYDPAYAPFLAQTLEGSGLNMIEVPQSDSRMCPAAETMYEAIVSGRIAHDGDLALRRHLMAASAKERPRGWRLTKPRGSSRLIDGAIALAIAGYLAVNTDEPSPPVEINVMFV